ncbi:MAG: ABC transporter substrate-binding protein [Alphaproteobacteria bacterium]|nr:ABC transporter substrate-binding protein [Alphaproteobacteria bacterium]
MFRFLVFCLMCLSTPAMAQDAPAPQHGIALHGAPKYGPDFTHLSYVNPNAPKGGTLKQAAIGSFDSLNPFIIKGTPAAGMNFLRSGYVYESLMQNAWDEPFSLYGILAQSIEVPEDKSWVAFMLRPEAKWADGVPVTAQDVVWTFNTLLSKGNPFFKAYYGDVEKVEALSDRRVKFSFKVKGNAELPLIVAEMAILPQHYWEAEGRVFDETSLEAPLGSGPYVVEKVEAGRSITFKKRDDWWGKDLPFFKGFYNFDRLEYDYYRDSNVAHEAFLAGEYDVKLENTAKMWATAYDSPALKSGKLIKEEIDDHSPAGMQGFIYNIRRPVFQDEAVRKALAYAFDFEWSNKQFAYGAYVRTNSYFDNSELGSNAAAGGLPSGDELSILERYRGRVPESVFTDIYKAPLTDGSGNNRANLRSAMQILDAAGYTLGEDGVRVKDGVRLEFEILDSNPQFERWVLPFIKNLERLGVKATFRVVDSAQYQNRMTDFDFDMTIGSFGQSSSPGNEQRDFWGSEKANMPGSRNYIGVSDPAVDAIIEELIHAESREDLVAHTRALDRILLHHYYVIPMWHFSKWRIAYWNKLAHPENFSDVSPLIPQTWWIKEGAE